MITVICKRNWRCHLTTVLALMFLSACSLPGAKKAVSERVWVLEDHAAVSMAGPAACIVRIGRARAAPGFNTTRMLYQRAPQRLEYFAWQSWADTPPAMLTSLVSGRLERSGTVAAAVTGTTDVASRARLDLDALRVLQVFESSGSYVNVELRAQLLSQPKRELLAMRRFAYRVAADQATPEAGVAAANVAVGRLLNDLQDFVASALANTSCPQ